MLPLAVLALLALAAYRATHLVVHDSIGDPVRDRLFTWHAARPDSPARTALITLISCTYCAGWWISGAALAAYLLATDQWTTAPLVVHGVQWLAVAGGQALLNRWNDTRDEAGS
ncbi:DUF1360 domain-containing protein [Streptomyces sp. NBC_00669]|uniref:DUF1360 domain-containing protein n=1 Tax=Streptomyces sp. NBC_00669 TaxID=2976011 RepID=UPI002E349431|nr:DUF1360 domain-containing protein [Streptomyces sp. NBC_00669]